MKHIKLFEKFEDKSTGFEYKDSIFSIQYIHTTRWRIIDKKTRTWNIVIGDNIDDAIKNAKELLDDVFENGRPNFYPRTGDKFIVTGDYYDYDNHRTKKIDSISFITGSHWQRPGGTGKDYAKEGDILTFDREGEDNGWWYINGGKNAEKGSKPWSLLWSKGIKEIK